MILGRDPFGIKPLYLSDKGPAVAFASELGALVAAGQAQPALDPAAVSDFLTAGFVLGPRTMLRDVRLMAPGTIECFEPDGTHRRIRYHVEPRSEPMAEPYEQAVERLRATFRESVGLHALADAPVGAFLSGGVDSTAVVAIIREHLSDLHTFSLDIPGGSFESEAEASAETARLLDTQHHAVEVSQDEAARLFPQFLGQRDQPSIDGFNTWLISRVAANEVTGVLSGLGGDEFFAGYAVVDRMQRWAASRWRPAVAAVGRLSRWAEHFVGPDRRLRRIDDVAARRSLVTLWLQTHRAFPEEMARRAVGAAGSGSVLEHVAATLDDVAPAWTSESPVGLARLLDTYLYMGNQLLRDSDVTSMAHSLELRVPFVDREIAEFSRTCADAYKILPPETRSAPDERRTKRILVDALHDDLPSHVIGRPKQGFSLPWGEMARGPMRAVVDDALRGATLRETGVVDLDVFDRVIDDGGRPGVATHPTWYPQNWTLAILELWCREHLAPT